MSLGLKICHLNPINRHSQFIRFYFYDRYIDMDVLGLIVVPSELVNDYKKILISYYEDENKKEDISNFLKNKC